MMHAVLGVGHLDWIELNGLLTIERVAEKFRRKEAQAGIGAEEIDSVFARLVILETGPTGLQRNTASALQTQQSHAKILHVEGSLRVHFAATPIHFTQTTVPKLGASLCADRDDFKLLHE